MSDSQQQSHSREHTRDLAAFAELTASERRARENEAKLHSILETIPDAVFLADRDGNLLQWNRAGEPLASTRATADSDGQWVERVGLYLADQRTLCPVDELPMFRALRGETVIRAELFMRSWSVWFSVNALPLQDDDGRPWGAVVVFRDITPERAAQARLMASDRLTTMGMLAAGLSHEINNPLAAVTGALDLAVDELNRSANRDEHMSTALMLLGEAHESAVRMRDIVDDLRIFSRAEEQALERVDVTRVLESALRMARSEIDLRARLVREFEPVPPILAVESRLGQAFLNLVMNAAQAIRPGRYDANCVRVGIRPDGPRVVVTVSDTGSGMSPEVQARLFTPFFTTKPAKIGTGLGLVITQRIIHSFDGEITFDSAPGRGSTFRVVFPAAVESSR